MTIKSRDKKIKCNVKNKKASINSQKNKKKTYKLGTCFLFLIIS